jgi:hypothetical protein
MGGGLGPTEGIRGERVGAPQRKGSRVGIREGGARLMRACAGSVSPGTPLNGRAARVHKGLVRRLASGRSRPERLRPSRRSTPGRPRAELDLIPLPATAKNALVDKAAPSVSTSSSRIRRSQARRAGGAGSGVAGRTGDPKAERRFPESPLGDCPIRGPLFPLVGATLLLARRACRMVCAYA